METCHCCINKTAPTAAEGQYMRDWVTYHSLTSLEDFLMWELDTLHYDAFTVCFPSRDPTQPNSLVSLKPISIGISSCTGNTSTIWFRIPISLCPQMPHIMPYSLITSSIPLSNNSCPGNSMRSPPHLLHPHLQSLPLTQSCSLNPLLLQSTPELQMRH